MQKQRTVSPFPVGVAAPAVPRRSPGTHERHDLVAADDAHRRCRRSMVNERLTVRGQAARGYPPALASSTVGRRGPIAPSAGRPPATPPARRGLTGRPVAREPGRRQRQRAGCGRLVECMTDGWPRGRRVCSIDGRPGFRRPEQARGCRPVAARGLPTRSPSPATCHVRAARPSRGHRRTITGPSWAK